MHPTSSAPRRAARPGPASLLAIAGLALLAAAFAYELWRHVGTAGDVWTFWAAARALAAGLDPYRMTALTAVSSPPAGSTPGPFLSPLFVAEMLRPLGALPFAAAARLWLALNLVLAVALVWLLLRLAGFRPGWRAACAGAALLVAFQPFDLTLWLGQTDVIVAVALAAGWLCLQRGRPLLGGLAVAAAAIDVHLMLGFGCYLLYRAVAKRDALPLVGLAAGLAALGALSLIHPADVARWVLVTLPRAQAAAIEPWDTLSGLQAASELLGRHGAWIPVAVVDAAMLGLAVMAWSRGGAARDRDLAVATVLTLASTTFAYNQDYLVLVLAFPFLARQWRAHGARWRTGAMAQCLAVGFGLAELTGGPVPPSHAAFILGAPILALAVCAGLEGAALRSAPPFRFWAGMWAVTMLLAYAVFTVSRTEIGPEVLILSGLLAFLVLVGTDAWRGHRPLPARPAPDRRRAQTGRDATVAAEVRPIAPAAERPVSLALVSTAAGCA